MAYRPRSEKSKARRRVHYAENRDKFVEQMQARSATAQYQRYRARYRAANPKTDRQKTQQRASWAMYADRINAARRAWRAAHNAEHNARKRAWYVKNRVSAIRSVQKALKENINYRVASRLRSRLRDALRRAQKAGPTMQLIGCDMPFLMMYLEVRFQPGMRWDNYGEWHIDHRIPCAHFDLTDPSQQHQCFNYSNLQPLWGSDNSRKGDRLPAPHQAELV